MACRNKVLSLVLIFVVFPGCFWAGLTFNGDSRVGTSRAYALLGEILVKHRGRIKPFETAAINEAWFIHGRSAITVFDPGGERTWEPVAAILNWSVRPEYWDNQDIILVESPRLRSLLSGAEKNRVRLSPRRLENAQIRLGNRLIAFDRWADELRERQDRIRFAETEAKEALSPIEIESVEVGERLRHYQALRDHRGPTVDLSDLMPIPRPANRVYLNYSSRAFVKGMDPNQTLSPLEADAANTLAEYLRSLPEQRWALPGEDGMFDQMFLVWLQQSAWIPLGIILECDDSELRAAGLPLDRIVAFHEAYRRFEAAERAKPGAITEDVAANMFAATRELGEDLSVYPSTDSLARETHLNRFAPFSKSIMVESFALACLLLGLVIAEPNLGMIFHGLGLTGHMAAAGLMAYGLLLRLRVFRHVPVATPYEVVLWAALIASVLGLAFEILKRKRYPALVASVIVILALSLTRDARSFALDSMESFPGFYSNRWLAGHAAIIVSGYGALAFAMGLGLFATILNLSAPLRSPLNFRGLAWPLFLGIFMSMLGRGRIAPAFQLPWPNGVNPWFAMIGDFLGFVGSFALLGEIASRSRPTIVALGGVVMLGVSMGILGVEDTWGLAVLGVVTLAMGLLSPWASRMSLSDESLTAVIDFAMRSGVLLVSVGVIVGVAWARWTWDESWLLDSKIVWTLATLLIYLVPIIGRLLGRMGSTGVIATSVMSFVALLMAWFVMNTLIRSKHHDYSLPLGTDVSILTASAIAMASVVTACSWRRMQGWPSP